MQNEQITTVLQCKKHAGNRLSFVCGLKSCPAYMSLVCKVCRNQAHSSHLRRVTPVDELFLSLKYFLKQKENLIPQRPQSHRFIRQKIRLLRQLRQALSREELKLLQAEQNHLVNQQDAKLLKSNFGKLRAASKRMQQISSENQFDGLLKGISKIVALNVKGGFQFQKNYQEEFRLMVESMKRSISQVDDIMIRCEEMVQKILDAIASDDYQIQLPVLEPKSTLTSQFTQCGGWSNLMYTPVIKQVVKSTKQPENAKGGLELAKLPARNQNQIKQLKVKLEKTNIQLKQALDTLQINQYEHRFLLRKFKEFKSKYQESKNDLAQSRQRQQKSVQTSQPRAVKSQIKGL